MHWIKRSVNANANANASASASASANAHSGGWQALYRALLRSSCASVRFCRPAARNTRRYLRDEFASALLARSTSNGQAPKTDRSGTQDGAISGVTGGDGDSIHANHLNMVTHKTLAFHLSASMLLSTSPTAPHRSLADGLSDQMPSHHINSSVSVQTITDHPPDHNHARQNLGHTGTRFGFGIGIGIGLDAMRGAQCDNAHANVGLRSKMPVVQQIQPTRTGRLAHRVIANLASLTYHHLSPYTQMQSRSHRKLNPALRKPKKLSSLARVLGSSGKTSPLSLSLSLSHDQDQVLENQASSHAASNASQSDLDHVFQELHGQVTLNEAHMKLAFLMPSIKPVRGPITSKLKEWDGQNIDKLGNQGNILQMQTDLSTIQKLLQDHDAIHPPKPLTRQQKQQWQQLRQEADLLKKQIKSAIKALAKSNAQHEMENIPIVHLANLVSTAQHAEAILLGKQRWTRRKLNLFLPP